MGIIRFLFAIAIISYHGQVRGLGFLLNNNTVVSAFFVISGFTAAFTLSSKYPFTKQGIVSYYRHRIARIYPLYFFALIFAFIINLILFQSSTPIPLSIAFSQLQHSYPLLTLHYIIENLTLFNGWHSWITAPSTIPLIVLPAWTLLVEFWFYTFAPFINRLSSKWIILLIMVSFMSRYVTYHHFWGMTSLPDNQFFLNQLIYFLLGIGSYRLASWVTFKRFSARIGVLALLIGLSMLGIVSASGLSHWLYLLVLGISLPNIQPLDLKFPAVKFFGEISYPLFLLHLPLVWLFQMYPNPMLQPFSILTLFTIIAICCAMYAVIRPLTKYATLTA